MRNIEYTHIGVPMDLWKRIKRLLRKGQTFVSLMYDMVEYYEQKLKKRN